MVVPSPRLGDQNEPRARIAELFLEQRPRVGGNEIAGGRRVAVMQYSRDSAAQQRRVKMVQLVVWIGETLGGHELQPRGAHFLHRCRGSLSRLLGHRKLPYRGNRLRIEQA